MDVAAFTQGYYCFAVGGNALSSFLVGNTLGAFAFWEEMRE